MARRYCITINNFVSKDEENLKALPYKYLIIGHEGEQGTPHLQVYVELKNAIRFTTMIKKLEKRAHIEIAKGSSEQNRHYCTKEENFTEFGQISQQGSRTDLDHIRRLALEGGMRTVTSYANMQQIRVAEKFLTYNEPPRDWQPNVIWIYGSSGSGKSRMARKIVSEDCYTKNTKSKWFDGYDGHCDLILDDFRDTWMDITDFLSIIDRYERQVETKGGMRQLRTQTIVITSIKHPREHYERADDEPRAQILRRCNMIIDKDLTISDVIEKFL